MQSTSLQVRLFLKKHQPKQDGTVPIIARVRLVRASKLDLSTNKSVLPRQWDDKKGIVINHPDATVINIANVTQQGDFQSIYTPINETRPS